MKILRLSTFLVILVLSTIHGFSLGASQGFDLLDGITAEGPFVEDVLAEPLPSTPTMDILPHRNILIIGVDQVTDPVVLLEGVWLLIFHRDTPEIEIIPIFPTISGDDPLQDHKLAGHFKLNSEGGPDEDFLDILREREILWHNYVLLDERALNAITDRMELPRARTSEYLQHWNDDALVSLTGQIALFDQLCQSFAQREHSKSISSFINNLAPFLVTDVPPEEIADDWRLLRTYGENLRCVFPTLTAPQD